jgi:hypothetical protein
VVFPLPLELMKALSPALAGQTDKADKP